jgi:predicted RNase H-like HicB family nuclease
VPAMLTIECDKEEDGRWIAEVRELPGVMAYGDTASEGYEKAKALALMVVADRVEHDEDVVYGSGNVFRDFGYPDARPNAFLPPRSPRTGRSRKWIKSRSFPKLE